MTQHIYKNLNTLSLQGNVFNGLKLLNKIGNGSFGVVYEAESLKTTKKYAVKVECNKTLNPQINFEFQVYSYLHKIISSKKLVNQYLPEIYGIFSNKDFTFLIMELFGKNLDQIFKQREKKIEKSQIIKYGIKMLKLIKFFHQSDLVYRDLKPQNFVFKSKQQQKDLYFIDLGLCKKQTNQRQNLLRISQGNKSKSSNSLIGTARYASINAHEGKQITKKDDIQSFVYILIYLLKGSLPWQGLKVKGTRYRNQSILKMKKNMTAEELCQDLPEQIINIVRYIKTYDKFYKKVDYDLIDQWLSKCLDTFNNKSVKKQQDSFQLGYNGLKYSVDRQLPQINTSQIRFLADQKHQDFIIQKQPCIKSFQKNNSNGSSQSQQLIDRSNLKRRKKPLLKRQFLIREEDESNEDDKNEISSEEQDLKSNKFRVPF